MLNDILIVAAEAIVGAVARFLITHISSELSQHHSFPYGTLVVNVVGCVIVGYVLTWTANHEPDRWRLLMATGFCGALTTFSAFAYEIMAYWHEGQIGAFMLNILPNNVLSLGAVLVGIKLHR
jgi:CrcB protein